LWHIHEDMYFGSSADSVGIQMVDICNYMVNRKLNGMGDTDKFCAIIKQNAICSKAEPEWTQNKTLLLEVDL